MGTNTTTSLQTFNFQTNAVRTLTIGDEPWFVAADILSTLTLDRKGLERLDNDEKGVSLIHTLGGQQEVTVINEFGLYSLILTSRKPQAKKFKRWVTHEVLPKIRQTGQYLATTQPALPARHLASYLPLVTEMARLSSGAASALLPALQPFAQALRAEAWAAVMAELETDEAAEWRALAGALQALQPPAANDVRSRANRLRQADAQLPPNAALTLEEVEEMMLLWTTRYATHPAAAPEVAQLWRDVLKLLRTGQAEAQGGRR